MKESDEIAGLASPKAVRWASSNFIYLTLFTHVLYIADELVTLVSFS